MTWLSYIFPQTMLITSSKYNKLIRINKESGKYKLLVNGSRQSGEYIRALWRKALKELGITSGLPIKKVLVLGVAGGTVIHELHKLYPQAKITGVEIDQVMLDIGKKYFGLKLVPHLTLVRADAEDFVKAADKELRYDLVVVDIFVGRQIPDFVKQENFLKAVKALLSPGGRVVINYLREEEYQGQSAKLLKTLRTIFPEVLDREIALNRFFAAY